MIIEAVIKKDGKFLVSHCASLDAGTQGRSLSELLMMTKDLVQGFCDKRVEIEARVVDSKTIEIEVQPSTAIIPAILRRQREKSGLTSRDVTAILGEKSPSSYSSYELGKRVPSAQKFEELLEAVSKRDRLKLRVG